MVNNPMRDLAEMPGQEVRGRSPKLRLVSPMAEHYRRQWRYGEGRIVGVIEVSIFQKQNHLIKCRVSPGNSVAELLTTGNGSRHTYLLSTWHDGYTAHPIIWGRSSVGRAPALQAGGREFDPPWFHQYSVLVMSAFARFSSLLNCNLC